MKRPTEVGRYLMLSSRTEAREERRAEGNVRIGFLTFSFLLFPLSGAVLPA